MSTDVTAVAELAYERICAGFLTGDWDPFFELVADEFDLGWPTEPGAGRYTGSDGRRRLEQQLRFFGGDYRLTDIRRTATTVNGDTVIFEDESRGDMGGTGYHARHCIFLTVRDGKVVGWREYVAQEPASA
jgi:ketosteroid isomerase-like protein